MWQDSISNNKSEEEEVAGADVASGAVADEDIEVDSVEEVPVDEDVVATIRTTRRGVVFEKFVNMHIVPLY
jgi:hypothetical protein